MAKALFEAVEAQDAERVRQWIARGGCPPSGFTDLWRDRGRGTNVDVHEEGYNGTPLFLAAAKKSPEIVKILLEAGANVNGTTSIRAMPLHNAAGQDSPEIVKILLEAGAHVNAATGLRATPLHNTAERTRGHCLEIAKILLEAGADVNAQDHRGATPLHTAAFRYNSEMVKILLEADADPRIKNRGGQTARDLVDGELASLLEGAMEDWTKLFVLQLSGEGTTLTFRTMGGNVACTLTWESQRPVKELPRAVLEAIRSSGFEPPFRFMRESSLRFVLPNGETLETSVSCLLEHLSAM